MKRTRLLCGMSVLFVTACGDPAAAEDAEQGCTGGKCDGQDGVAVCDAFLRDHSLGGIDSFSQLGDRLATGALTDADACPSSMAEILSALQASDETCDRVEVALVSETAQVLGADDPSVNYRAVIPQVCGSDGFSLHKLMFSVFGLRKNGRIPRGFEIAALDERTGAYNYYELGGTAREPVWSYFGNSFEQVELYTDAFDHDEYAKQTKEVFREEARCGACHTGGGPIMKELDSPWVHWAGSAPVPGGEALIDRIAETVPDTNVIPSDGIMVEAAVKEGNQVWNDARREALLEAGKARALLRPLFCSVEANVISKPGLFLDAGAVVNDELLFQGEIFANGFSFSNEAYKAAADELGTRDTFFQMTFMEPAFADRRYISDLVNEELIDADLAADVLSIDFTRPVYSDDRCGLLELIPERMDVIDPDAIRDVLRDALRDPEPGTPQADLLANLDDETNRALGDTVVGFFDACHARDEKALAEDVLAAFAVTNERARQFAFIEFERSLPGYDRSKLPGKDARLDPTTCELVEFFVSAPIGGGSSIEETFDGPGVDVSDAPAGGVIDSDWQVWFDGDEAWGSGHTMSLSGSAQTVALRQGSFGIRREFGDVAGMTATLDYSFAPDGESWFEVLADDGVQTPLITSDYSGIAPCSETGAAPCTLTVHHEAAAGGEPLPLPAGTQGLRVKVGSLNGDVTSAVLRHIEIR